MGGSGLAITLGILCMCVGFDVVSGYYDDNSCYFCSDTGSNPDCRDYKALKKAVDKQDDKDQVLLRNCSSDEPYCMIEVYIKLGQVYSYIRDCTSNEADSFSFLKEGRLKRVTTSNITTCTFDKTTMGQMCLTLCQGKQCNGPLNTAGVPHQGFHAVLISIGLIVYQTVWSKYGIN